MGGDTEQTDGVTPLLDSAQGDTRGPTGGPGEEGVWPGFPVPGRPWGKYLIEKKLGEGGQSLVFQAFDSVGPAGHVALKVPRGPISAERPGTWPGQEAQALVKLDHPNVVQVVDAGIVEGVPYVATRLVDGLPLDARVKSQPPSLAQVIGWMIQITDAVATANAKGIVHRDIKPSNIIVTAEGKLLLIDFGVSTMVSAYQPVPNAGRSGTPAFMAPEQARGEPSTDHRVDIFALGSLLKFLLDGSGPYGQTGDQLEAARAGRIQPLRCDQGPPVRRRLAGIANRALAADANQRYGHAGELLRALRGIRGRRQWLGVAAVACVLGVAATALWPFLRQVLSPPVRPPASPAITASLEIHFQRADQFGSYQILTVDLLPLRSGDRVQFHARLSEPLWTCLIALSSNGQATVLYPAKADPRGPTTAVEIPPGRDQWLPLTPPGGTETIVLLARRLKVENTEDLPRQLAALGPPPSFNAVGLLVMEDGPPRFLENKAATLRSIGDKPVTVKKGLLSALADKVPGEWEIVRAVAFTHQDGPDEARTRPAGNR